MSDATQIALSAQIALMRHTEIIANNVANLSTNGYKAERMVFAEHLARVSDGGLGSYVQTRGTVRDTSQGPITQTNNPLDVALEGDGYLAVQTPNGIRYTRNGHFQLDAQGQIVTSQGFAVLDGSGSPITIPSGATDITIGIDGTILTSQGRTGQLQLDQFQNAQAMLATGNGLYDTSEGPAPATGARVVQGSLEQSNVLPIIEMTQLIAAERAVNFVKDFTATEGNRISNAIDRLGKVA